MDAPSDKVDDCAREDGKEDDFFRFPGVLSMIWVPLGMLLLTLAHFAPDTLPYDTMGPLGPLTLFMVRRMPFTLKGICYTAWAAHFVEAYFAYRLCDKHKINSECTRWWIAQTAVYGIFSLKYLVSYDPKLKEE